MVEGSGLENHQADSIRAGVRIPDPALEYKNKGQGKVSPDRHLDYVEGKPACMIQSSI